MKSSHFNAVDAVDPIAPYLGGKRNLAKNLTGRIAAIKHQTYCEPFIGMGGVFLRRAQRAKAEVINDIKKISPPCFAFSSATTRNFWIRSNSRLPAGLNSTV